MLEIALPFILLISLLAIILQISFPFFLLLFIITILIILIVLYYVGQKRHNEITNIKSVFHSIRKNRFSSPDEIKLGRNLVELEGEIKSMFLKTRNDIENMKKMEQVRTEFLGNVSHELRTPIFWYAGLS